jgi:hypothetical protein
VSSILAVLSMSSTCFGGVLFIFFQCCACLVYKHALVIIFWTEVGCNYILSSITIFSFRKRREKDDDSVYSNLTYLALGRTQPMMLKVHLDSSPVERLAWREEKSPHCFIKTKSGIG